MFDLIFAIIFGLIAASYLIRGRFAVYGRAPVTRVEEPRVFWRNTALAVVLAAYASLSAYRAFN